ncbi:MAG TPA: ABC transporter ATP-binding protein [Anaeromyxobacter sp.]|nr:ABC transporter ATP-binding protein [Anaeromyxobacter sp.]
MDDRVMAEGVRKRFGRAVVLDGASLSFRRGETLALLGRNGAGKTTLVRILAGALARDGGRVTVLGRELDRASAEVAHLCGWVAQDSERSAYPRLTVRENLRFFGALRGLRRAELDARIARLAGALGFAPRLDALFGTLSGGQKQAVVIARALLHDPPVAFLDEPTKGLDPLAAHGVRAFLRREVQRGLALLLTSHVLADLDALADGVAVVDEGRIRTEASPAALVAALGAKDAAEVARALGLGAAPAATNGAQGVA